MTAAENVQLRGLWAMYAAYYQRQLSDAVLIMYADDLSDLDFSKVRDSLENYRRNPKNKFLPLPAMIRETLDPQVDPDSAAREVAALITGAIVKYGWINPILAREAISEIGWQIVERQGGWMHLCQNHGVTIDPTTFQAQIREQAKSNLIHSPEAMNRVLKSSNAILNLIEPIKNLE
jgi:hypothetical protein